MNVHVTTTTDLLTSAQTLAALKLKSRTSLSMLVHDGHLKPAIETSNGRLFRRIDVERLAKKRARQRGTCGTCDGTGNDMHGGTDDACPRCKGRGVS